jgi:acetyl esterase/lipase
MFSAFLGVSMLALAALPVMAGAELAPPAEPQVVNVWPGLAPGETTSDPGKVTDDHGGNITRLGDITCPQLIIFRPDDNQPHPAVMVGPGGGYGILASDLEGTEIAIWLNTLGYTAAVLHYRVPNKREGAFQDAERAMSLLRYRAKEFGIDPNHLGVLGFSAGGHLSARLACGFAKRAYTPIDKIDEVSCRPDFAVLIYPAYLIDKNTGLPAPEVQPQHDTPPMFLSQTEDDPFLDAPDYAKALDAAGVPNHAVIYPKGGHGYGLRTADGQPSHPWWNEAATWIEQQVEPKGAIH